MSGPADDGPIEGGGTGLPVPMRDEPGRGLTLTGVSVSYGPTEAVHGVDWSVGGDCPVTALLGPSGCGKSTLLRAIAGLEPLSSGTVAFDGRDLAGVPVHHRDFGVVFQDGQLFPGRTVRQNIAYGLARRGIRGERARRRVDDLLELVQLPGAGERRVTELSGGQAQRVALARALAPKPRMLLLDEPLAALDRRLRDELAVAIADIVRTAGTPTVVVTHDHGEAAAMADTVSVMNAGRIVDTATPSRLWRRPADAWVADFLGAERVVGGVLAGGVLTTPVGAVDVGGVPELADLAEGPHRVALRPDAVTAVADPAGAGRVVRAVAAVGSWRLVVVIDAADDAATEVELDAVSDAPIAAGERVALVPVAERLAVIGA